MTRGKRCFGLQFLPFLGLGMFFGAICATDVSAGSGTAASPGRCAEGGAQTPTPFKPFGAATRPSGTTWSFVPSPSGPGDQTGPEMTVYLQLLTASARGTGPPDPIPPPPLRVGGSPRGKSDLMFCLQGFSSEDGVGAVGEPRLRDSLPQPRSQRARQPR